jgi:NADH dehydrogenase [ubiquinone] 1 alpha subcomplex assembly factor 3
VFGLKNGFFSINGLWMPGSVLLFPNRAFMWGVIDAHDIKTHTLDILKIIKPRPSNYYYILLTHVDYFIIGTGKYMVDFDESFFQYFREHKMLVEAMPTVIYRILIIS